jgi:ParB-like chromosome segregation protein Spo0J
MMLPKDISPSPFGSDVNPTATDAEKLALRESIAESGIKMPLTVGRVKGRDKLVIVNGTRRLKTARELNLPAVPVIIKDYGSIEEMRQDALRDNLERRQLTLAGRAELANSLWRSYDRADDKKEMTAKGVHPRKRAAIAGGLSEGSLVNFRYVLDSGIDHIINEMRSDRLSINKAYELARKEVDGVKDDAGKQGVPVRLESLLADLNGLESVLKNLSEIIRRTHAAQGVLAEVDKGVRAKVEKKILAAGKVIAAVQSGGALDALYQALTSSKPDMPERRRASRDGHTSVPPADAGDSKTPPEAQSGDVSGRPCQESAASEAAPTPGKCHDNTDGSIVVPPAGCGNYGLPVVLV